MNDDEPLVFAEDTEESAIDEKLEDWNILIVDDEQAVHDVTVLALKGFRFNNKAIHFLHAYSASEAQTILEQHQDVAVALVDVVMETDDAGIRLVKWIRDEQKNSFIRLVLRTGQPGQAPEKQVILDLDINDYKEKTELTSTKLFTLMVTTLRSYESLQALECSRLGLEKIVNSSRGLSTHGSIEVFVQGVLIQLQAVFGVRETAFYCARVENESKNEHGFNEFLIVSNPDTNVVSGTRKISIDEIRGSKLEQGIKQTLDEQKTLCIDNSCYIYFKSESGNECVVFFDRLDKPLNTTERSLLDVFCNNINFAFDNLSLNKEIDNNQREIVFTLGTIAEFRSRETGRHIVRVSKSAELLGKLYGLPEEETDLLLKAMPMHDVGKIAIQDAILHKPGQLTDEEMEVMKTHAEIGYQMLKNSKRALFEVASIIARQHHERWDGQGYPKGLSGKDIHIYGRIAAVADVFDALSHERIYKPAWSIDAVVDHFREQRGKHFDPELTDLLLDNLQQFLDMVGRYRDQDYHLSG